jgi:hypothetical protein
MLHQKSEFTPERYLFAQISQKSEFKYKIVKALRLQFVHEIRIRIPRSSKHLVYNSFTEIGIWIPRSSRHCVYNSFTKTRIQTSGLSKHWIYLLFITRAVRPRNQKSPVTQNFNKTILQHHESGLESGGFFQHRYSRLSNFASFQHVNSMSEFLFWHIFLSINNFDSMSVTLVHVELHQNLWCSDLSLQLGIPFDLEILMYD